MFDFVIKHKGTAAGIVVVVIAAAWYVLTQPSSSGSLLETSGNTASGPEQQVVNTLLQLRSISLSGTILTDPAFQSLHDFSIDLVPEPVGRDNPFAPVALPTFSSTTIRENTNLFAPKKN